ncbi:unnamed protein product [Caenorhabditis angaria]|uniref:DUF3719 domain-containing protein n=1 Tax=Caenorhabditis angaria TaxID=860376 RepID=A0A9P1IPG2_9PELO|nr:unnamed protein product [Caenorhabditis angaria]
MLTWSTTTTDFKNFKQNSELKVAENFLKSWDAAVYEGEKINDPILDAEAKLWREKFVHLRVVGKNCEDPEKSKNSTMKVSKSANTSRDFSLPPIKK